MTGPLAEVLDQRVLSAPFGQMTPVLSKTTVAHAVLHKLYLKRQIKVFLCTFLTQQANLGKFTLRARFCKSFSSNSATSCQIDVFCTFSTKDANFKQNRSCARCFEQVLSQTANRSFLHVFSRSKPILSNLHFSPPFS